MTGELDDADEAVAERVRRSNARVFAAYLVVQAVVGLAFWVGLAVSDEVRKLFELVPEVRSVTSTWLFADLVVGVLGSALGAYALWADARWARPPPTRARRSKPAQKSVACAETPGNYGLLRPPRASAHGCRRTPSCRPGGSLPLLLFGDLYAGSQLVRSVRRGHHVGGNERHSRDERLD